MPVTVTRFAPSPTGALHLGHGFCAVQVHALARRAGGRFLLRMDDIDGSRSRPQYVDGALDILRWMGLDWDEAPIFQSAHLAQYQAALDELRGKDLLYPCFCTRADIAASLSAPHGPSGILYPGTCRDLHQSEQQRRCASEPHCWRLDMAKAVDWAERHYPHGLIWYEEGAGNLAGMGPQRADPMAHGDIVLARKDAPASYHLASSVDDAMMGVTHVVRGADLRQSTDVHRLLQALLGWPTPIYHHHMLICGPDGRRLAKRDQAASLDLMRQAGLDGRNLADQLRQHKLPTGYSFQKA
jgi:glutamyl-Q tRNA(Asp) synthetase